MKSFGKAKFSRMVHGNSEFFIVRYESKRYPGHDFTFKRPGSAKNNRGNGLYHCVDCKTLKNKYRIRYLFEFSYLNFLELDYQVPAIKIVNEAISEFDPDHPKCDHFCVPETENYPFSHNINRSLVITDKKGPKESRIAPNDVDAQKVNFKLGTLSNF